jgi:hypothetical protein
MPSAYRGEGGDQRNINRTAGGEDAARMQSELGTMGHRCANLLGNSLKPLRPVVIQPVPLLQSTVRLVRLISKYLSQCSSLSYIWRGADCMIRGSNPAWGRDFSPIQNVQLYSGTHQVYSVVTGDSEISQYDRLTTQPHLALRWRMGGAIPPHYICSQQFFFHKSRAHLKILDATGVT